jgi:hypothetical protein
LNWRLRWYSTRLMRDAPERAILAADMLGSSR